MVTARSTQAAVFEPGGSRLVVRTELGALIVDASGHALWVKTPRGEIYELGASSAGLEELVVVAAESIELSAGAEGPALCTATEAALRSAAADRGLRLGPVERRIHAIHPSVHLYSGPFLRADFLRKDVATFPACRVAVACLQRVDRISPAPEGVESHVERLQGWRALWREGGTSKKIVNRLLSEVGDDVAWTTLWGLRRARLSRMPETNLHLAVLGALGAHPLHADLAGHMELVERTSAADLHAALNTLAGHPVGQAREVDLPDLLAELIGMLAVGPKTSLRRLVRTALLEVSDHARRADVVAEPPWGLPAIRGIRFLRTTAEIVEEGVRMFHCVGSRAPRALRGESFLFHIDHEGEQATAEVNAAGRIVEIRGPGNRPNRAVEWARGQLLPWAARAPRPKRKPRCPLPLTTPIWLNDRPVPRGAVALRTAGEATAFYERMMRDREDLMEARFAWLMRHVERAAYGAAYISVSPADGAEITRVHDFTGKLVEERRWEAP